MNLSSANSNHTFQPRKIVIEPEKNRSFNFSDNRFKSKKVLIIISLFFVLISILIFNFFNKQDASEYELILREISQVIELPREQPVIGVVNDEQLIKDNPFFANAKQNDLVIVFPIAGNMLLYRPDSKKIIHFGSLPTKSNELIQSSQN